MVLLQVKDLTKNYGARVILDKASASFSRNQKIGVIGRNGAGKSTLCNIITGKDQQDSGEIIFNRELKLSYLEQHDTFKPEESVSIFLMRDSGREEWECAEMAAKFGIDNEQLNGKVSDLAGGYRTRVKLAAMLLPEPNFLILDEPSNYLDLSTLILLENFLIDFRGGYLVVSHDREFLKRTCDHTLEVSETGMTLYPGNIEEYFEFKEEQLAQKIAYNRNIEKKKADLQAFVDRFRAKASTATRAKSKMKQIEKLKTIEIAHTSSQVKIKMPWMEPKSGIALRCQDLSIGYPDKNVAAHIDFEIERGMRVAVLGNNGEGKTTFLRTIADDLQATDGRFLWGSGLKVAYYAQHVFQALHPSDDIFTHLQREAAEDVNRQEILDMAGAFLFKGDDVKKKVAILSGGERARLCLAGLLLSKSQVLLLDEPTNHLDFETVEALGQALKSFAGTLFFVSHDRTFVNLVATTILEVSQGMITRYPGIYEDYVYHLECLARGEKPPERLRTVKKAKKADAKKKSTATSRPADAEAEKAGLKRKKIKAEIRKCDSKIKKSEGRMKHFKEEQENLQTEIQKNPFHFSKDRNKRLKELQISLEAEEDAYLRLLKERERLEKSL